MLSSKEEKIYFFVGVVIAELCIRNNGNYKENLNRVILDLRPGVDIRLKDELIYFRIFVAYFKFETELDNERFKKFLSGFQSCLLDEWDRQLLGRVQDKLKEYASKFVIQENNYLKLTVSDSIVDELLINAGFGVSDLFLFDRTELKEFFREDCIAHKQVIENFISLLSKDEEERDEILKAMNINIDDFVQFESSENVFSENQNTDEDTPKKEVTPLQLNLDEEIVVGNIPLNGMPIPGSDRIAYEGDYHIMHVSLVRYKDRRYISISRMHYHRLKRTGEIKKTFRNSIWIPISRVKDVIELLRNAEYESEKLNWEDYYIDENLKVSAEILDEGESKKRLLTNVCKAARDFLICAANYLDDKLTLEVNVKDISEKMRLPLPLVLRVVDYLEDAGYIKQVEKFSVNNSNSKENLIEYLPKIINLLPNDDIEDIILDRAKVIGGLSDDDFEALDYLDDDDPRISRLNYAKRFAETEIISEFIAGQIPISFKITAAGYNWIED